VQTTLDWYLVKGGDVDDTMFSKSKDANLMNERLASG
jgi:hypothetical protein